jgi:hypothetical protein
MSFFIVKKSYFKGNKISIRFAGFRPTPELPARKAAIAAIVLIV